MWSSLQYLNFKKFSLWTENSIDVLMDMCLRNYMNFNENEWVIIMIYEININGNIGFVKVFAPLWDIKRNLYNREAKQAPSIVLI